MYPLRNPSAIIFYDPDGEESELMLASNVSRVFEDGVQWTVADLIGKASKRPNAEQIMRKAKGLICS